MRSPLNADWGGWKFEVLALVGSACSFIALVVVLAVYNGRPIFDSKKRDAERDYLGALRGREIQSDVCGRRAHRAVEVATVLPERTAADGL